VLSGFQSDISAQESVYGEVVEKVLLTHNGSHLVPQQVMLEA
jgi:hypothetical protein